MGKKLKMPAGGLFNEQPEAEVAPPTVADQAAALLESADDSPESPDESPDESTPEVAADELTEAAGPVEAESAEPEIADADVAVCPEMVAETATPEEQPEPTPKQDSQAAINKARADWWQQLIEWEADVVAAKERHTAAAITQAKVKEAHKLAKAAEELALEELMDLMRDKPEEPKLADVLAASAREAATAGSSPGSSTPSPTTADQPASVTSPPATDWRVVPIEKLDLPEKLIERLQEDGLTTMGRLEDRRGEISEGKAKWPKGIGAAKITKIEDAVIEWLTKNRDQAVFAELQPGVGESGTVADPAATTAAGEPQQSAVGWSEVDAFSDAINTRAVELDTGESGCLDEKLKDAGYWDLGYQTYENGGNLATCGLPPSPAQDDFIRGWLAAGQAEDSPDATAELEEPPEGEEPELEAVGVGVDGPQLFDPDNI